MYPAVFYSTDVSRAHFLQFLISASDPKRIIFPSFSIIFCQFSLCCIVSSNHFSSHYLHLRCHSELKNNNWRLQENKSIAIVNPCCAIFDLLTSWFAFYPPINHKTCIFSPSDTPRKVVQWKRIQILRISNNIDSFESRMKFAKSYERGNRQKLSKMISKITKQQTTFD